ncbi:MAG: pyridoxamine 5'-phosphate oxidase family protein, partial [Myxococcota bacterium]|nr:pyridoxamine 5'-phosphate oxidase family protein [Myxococcota bacterium]
MHSSKGHGSRRGRSQKLLYDPEIPTPTHAERARTLVDQSATGTLCTVSRELDGAPYGSFVTFALDGPRPVFLVSELAEHTQNLRGDSRCSLLVSEH